MLELSIAYDPVTRMLSTSDEYAGTVIDNLSARITVTGLPDGYSARLDFRVKVKNAEGRTIYPYLALDASGTCTLSESLLKACKRDLGLPIQLVLVRSSGDDDEVIASRNSITLSVAPAIDAMGSIIEVYRASIERAFIDVSEQDGRITFTRLDGSTVEIGVDDDFVPWSDVVTEWPDEPSDERVPSVKAVDDTFLKQDLDAPNRILMTDSDMHVGAYGPRVVSAWSPAPSDDNLPTEALVKGTLDEKAQDDDVVHIDEGSPLWDEGITYHAGSTVSYHLNFYMSQNDNNIGHDPEEVGTVWWSLVQGGGGGGGDTPGAYKVFTVGDGSTTDFLINHAFNSYNVAHLLYSNGGSMADGDALVERTTKNHIRITFHTAPSQGEFTLVVYRPGIGPESCVTSINDMQGDVDFTADLIHALSTDEQSLTDEQKAQAKANIELELADNTPDSQKPVSGPQQDALDDKVDKIPGKGLSTEDYTTAEKTKLASVAEGAEVNVNADWEADSGDAQILNRPTLGTVAEKDAGTAAGQVPVLNANGKLPDSTIPPLAIGEYAGSVTTKADLVTLSNAQKGDIAKVTNDADVNNDGVWFLNGTYSDLTAWIQIVGPGTVISVNGQTGVVTLTASDVGAVPTSRTVNGKALSSNISLVASDVGAVPTTRKVNGKALSTDISLTPADVGAVPPERTVNGKALSSDVALVPADVGAVPSTRTVNGHQLSDDISLDADDVGAVAANAGITAGTFPKITFDAKGLIILGEALAASDIPGLPASKIVSGTFNIARIPTGNAANKVLMLSEVIGEGQSIRRTSSGWEPFTPSSSDLAIFTGTITGDGTATVFTFAHGLSGVPVVTMYKDGEVVGSKIECTSANITVTFYTAPSAGETYTVKAIA